MYTLESIGKACKSYRRSLGYTQIDVANETGYTQQNISRFEKGTNDNSLILMWYVRHGMVIEDFERGKYGKA